MSYDKKNEYLNGLVKRDMFYSFQDIFAYSFNRRSLTEKIFFIAV